MPLSTTAWVTFIPSAKRWSTFAPDTRVLVTDNAEQIRSADRVILPGVGAIRDCMAEIRRLGIDELVREVSADRPLLGICVGMQALMSRSEENGWVDCIDLFPTRRCASSVTISPRTANA